MRHGSLAAMAMLAGMVWSPPALSESLLDLAGSSYRGPVTVETQQGSTIQHSASGEADISLSEDKDGLLLLKGEATIDGEVAMRFDFTLRQQADGVWRDHSDDGQFEISPEGEISLVAPGGSSTVVADGRIDATALEMQLQTSGHAVEPDLVFVFDLVRHETAVSDRTNDCGHTVWQPRAIANPYGGAMSSIMVPVCVPTP